MLVPLLAILLTGLYMRVTPGNANPYNVEWSSLGLCCSSDEALLWIVRHEANSCRNGLYGVGLSPLVPRK